MYPNTPPTAPPPPIRPPHSCNPPHNSSPSDFRKKKKESDRCLWLSPSLRGTPGKTEASGNECVAPPDALPCTLTPLSATNYAFCFPPELRMRRGKKASGVRRREKRRWKKESNEVEGRGWCWGVRSHLKPDAGQWSGTPAPRHPPHQIWAPVPSS